MKLGFHVNMFGKYGCSSAFVHLHIDFVVPLQVNR